MCISELCSFVRVHEFGKLFFEGVEDWFVGFGGLDITWNLDLMEL